MSSPVALGSGFHRESIAPPRSRSKASIGFKRGRIRAGVATEARVPDPSPRGSSPDFVPPNFRLSRRAAFLHASEQYLASARRSINGSRQPGAAQTLNQSMLASLPNYPKNYLTHRGKLPKAHTSARETCFTSFKQAYELREGGHLAASGLGALGDTAAAAPYQT